MAKDITIGGHKINKWWLIGGAGAVVGVWYLYKRGAASSSSSSSTDPNAIDPITGLPYSEDNQIDPITGLSYLQEAQQYGSVTAAEQEITSGSAYYGNTGTGTPYDSGYPTISGITSPGSGTSGQSFSTNAAWAQAVTAGLVNLGYSAQDVSAALGLYFQGQPLGSGSDGVSYVSIIQAAIAEFGPPPVGSFSIIAAPSSGGSNPPVTQPAPGNPPPKPTPPPTVKPKYAEDPPPGFGLVSTTATTASFHWTKQGAPCTGYAFTIYSGATLIDNRPALTASTTSVSSQILRPSTKYVAKLRALPQAPGSDGASITFTTPAAPKANPGGPNKT